jgi:1,2-phenylacetyl-CoA epoxidase catalytic subunit
MHLDAWLRRLAANPDAHSRLSSGLRALWADALAVFSAVPGEDALLRGGELPEPMEALRARWLDQVGPVLADLGLPGPTHEDLATDGQDGRSRRTDDFRWLHGQFTMVAASERGATW